MTTAIGDIESRVIFFTSDFLGVNPTEKISLSTKIADDLWADGDDALEFLEKFSEEFDVDISEFEFNRYFSTERDTSRFFVKLIFFIFIAFCLILFNKFFIILIFLILLLFFKRLFVSPQFSLTVGDLVCAVKTGKLSDEMYSYNKPEQA
ncbi:hypothetical protein AGMMS49545_12540 [Betaproteobacteria bacterium]|nr:hypothetical protein AGMMS49545_12540 [Betaproteobacteria bacterium]GHU45870.1 hypothetical protein AGMMS50289_17950 [Betaproteobacteria bacterium]